METPPRTAVPPALARALSQVAEGRVLTRLETEAAFDEIMQGSAGDEAIARLLTALRERGEQADEVAGAVTALRRAMRGVAHPAPDRLVDTCGTGGGRVRTLNISTAAAFVAAGAGAPVAKHGNRSFTSRSGSADVLEALGVPINLEPDAAATILARHGIVFLFAPTYHPAMRHVAAARRSLGVATLMNLVGPLANPAGARRQVVGVSDPRQGPLVADALAQLGTLHGMVVHAEIGVDEIAPVGMTQVWEVRGRVRTEWQLDPVALGLGTASLDGLEGGEPGENGARIEALFRVPGEAPSALRSAVLLNAAAALRVAGIANSMEDGSARAAHALDSGAAWERLERLRSTQ